MLQKSFVGIGAVKGFLETVGNGKPFVAIQRKCAGGNEWALIPLAEYRQQDPETILYLLDVTESEISLLRATARQQQKTIECETLRQQRLLALTIQVLALPFTQLEIARSETRHWKGQYLRLSDAVEAAEIGFIAPPVEVDPDSPLAVLQQRVTNLRVGIMNAASVYGLDPKKLADSLGVALPPVQMAQPTIAMPKLSFADLQRVGTVRNRIATAKQTGHSQPFDTIRPFGVVGDGTNDEIANLVGAGVGGGNGDTESEIGK